MSLIITSIDRAALELEAGNPVAIPTETVYGLAALINNPEAIKAVFTMKQRPMNHPLIIHVAKDADLSALTEEIPEYAHQLMKAFWPGPLTLVFRCNRNQVSPLITGGQDSVAIRSPAHPIAQKLLKKLDTPFVAPSANLFCKVSPTTALHVKESFPDKNLLILDGGRCTVGIESTIVDATCPDSYQILRHGLIDEEAIAAVVDTHYLNNNSLIRVPGALESHYQPQKMLYYFDTLEELTHFCEQRKEDVYVIANKKPDTVPDSLYYPLGDNPKQAAFDLYYHLRQADDSKAMCIAIELPPKNGAWYGIYERILKAGFPYSK